MLSGTMADGSPKVNKDEEPKGDLVGTPEVDQIPLSSCAYLKTMFQMGIDSLPWDR
jgi:hypothetical protein